MDKDVRLRAGEWDGAHLTLEQQKYAALDAQAALRIAYTLCRESLDVPQAVSQVRESRRSSGCLTG